MAETKASEKASSEKAAERQGARGPDKAVAGLHDPDPAVVALELGAKRSEEHLAVADSGDVKAGHRLER